MQAASSSISSILCVSVSPAAVPHPPERPPLPDRHRGACHAKQRRTRKFYNVKVHTPPPPPSQSYIYYERASLGLVLSEGLSLTVSSLNYIT